jgi:translation initiation factor 2 beta subunit (eIF-2beta)/eIF-5
LILEQIQALFRLSRAYVKAESKKPGGRKENQQRKRNCERRVPKKLQENIFNNSHIWWGNSQERTPKWVVDPKGMSR